MQYFDKTFFKFFFGLIVLIGFGLFFVVRANAQVVNEVMYDSPGADDDWVEIYNNSQSPISIVTGSGSGSWRFVDTGSHVFTLISGTASLPAGGYAIITNDAAKFQTDNPSFSGSLFKSSFSLTNTSNTIAIKNGAGTPTDQVSYASSQGASGDGNSLSRQVDGSWLAVSPTPGGANSSAPLTVPGTGSGGNGSSTATTTDDTPVVSQVPVGALSSHYSFVPIYYDYNANEKFKVTAGRDRLGFVGAPLAFKAVSNTNDPNTSYLWNFGDGSTGQGKDAMHTYTLEGKYVIVLDAMLFDNEAVSRTTVQVVEPSLSVAFVSPDYISVKNNSKYEMNLYGWRLTHGLSAFDFPKDTIIPAGMTVSFPSSVTRLSPMSLAEVALVKQNESASPQKLSVLVAQIDSTTTDEKQKSIDDLTLKLSHAEKVLHDMLVAEEDGPSSGSLPTTPPRSSDTASVVNSTEGTSTWATTLKHFFGLK